MPRKRFAFPAYLPDQIANSDVLTVATNVLPAANGYRPVASFMEISDALSATFKGGGAFISSDGGAYLLAGTASGLERFTAGSWSTLLTAMSVTDRWRFAQFGNFVVAVNGVDTKQIDLNGGTASDLTAPSGNGVAVVGDFVVITQADGDRLKVSWSAFNNHTAWTAGTDQSGFQPMLTGGEVKGIAGGEYGIILQRFRLVRMERTGEATAPFSFSEITPNFGCASAGSIAQAGRSVFFLSDRGFMVLEDGQALKPIGNEKIDASFREQVDQDDYDRLWSAVDPKRSLVFWGSQGSPGRVWCYNWVLDRWTTLQIGFNGFFAGYESSLTLEQVASLYPNIDTMPYSLDDPRFQGGDPRLYFVSTLNEIGALSGPNLEATIKTGWLAPSDPQVSRIRAVWPITDATSGVTVTIDSRQRMGDPIDGHSVSVMQASGRAPVRCRARYMTLQHVHAAGSMWTYSQGADVEFDAGGLR